MKYVWLIAIFVFIIPISNAETNPEIQTEAYTEGRYTVITGQYYPFTPGRDNIPDGTKVYIYCDHEGKIELISSAMNRLTSLGLYGVSVNKDICTAGDMVRACIDNPLENNRRECSEWFEVGVIENDDGSNIDMSAYDRRRLSNFPSRININFAKTQIFGVPEYSILSAGLLVICTIGAIAVLRGGRHK